MMQSAGFVGQSIVLADGGRGAVVKTSASSARPSPGSSVLLETADGWRIVVVDVVLAEAGRLRGACFDCVAFFCRDAGLMRRCKLETWTWTL